VILTLPELAHAKGFFTSLVLASDVLDKVADEFALHNQHPYDTLSRRCWLVLLALEYCTDRDVLDGVKSGSQLLQSVCLHSKAEDGQLTGSRTRQSP
jgi:hypothetical protein